MDVEIKVLSDTASPAVAELVDKLTGARLKRAVGAAAARLTQDHLRQLGPNKRGWPTTGFYQGAATGTYWEPTADGVKVLVDNESAPGAMRQRFHGGTIEMKDKMLTIPAAPQFYGHAATDFTGLRFAVLGGHPALVTRPGDVGLVDFATGRSRSVKGTGARSQAMVAFWLKESVDQDPDPDVLPSAQEYQDAAIEAVAQLVSERRGP